MSNIADVEQWLSTYMKYTKWTSTPERGLLRMREVLAYLGDPQKKYKILHVAGTSGKGTTTYMMAYLLGKLGCKVGSTFSPHILDMRERCMINNQMVSQERFVACMEKVRDAVMHADFSAYGNIVYFEIMTCVAFLLFAEEQVDYAVLETGLGGKYDATNVIDDPAKVAVITSIGFDHEKVLGDTLAKIAAHKAMIVHEGNRCFSYEQGAEIVDTLNRVVDQQKGILELVPIRTLRCSAFPGQHNQINASLACRAVEYVAERDSLVSGELAKVDIAGFLEDCPNFFGRGSIKNIQGHTVIVDGAHNIQKMHGLLQMYAEKYKEQKAIFIVAFKRKKNFVPMLSQIIPYAQAIYVTQFGEEGEYGPISSSPAQELLDTLQEQGCTGGNMFLSPTEALEEALRENTSFPIVITGSFYLISALFSSPHTS